MVTCLDGCSLGFSTCAASIRGPAGVAVAEIFTDDLGAETVEWDCWAYEDTHNTIATKTSNGLKNRKNWRTLRFIVTNQTTPNFDFVYAFVIPRRPAPCANVGSIG
jgi:hypothetical protein